MKIVVKNNNVDKAIRMLKRKTKEKLMELRERQHYVKPSERKGIARQAAVVRERKRQKQR